uniref:NADH-ubiquinone oxidoreductase chain 4 n=1 Tax=Lamprotula scripta TaxID=332925 RepID=A0A172QDM0_9BIVA|nr:NADH dehydrogenase subunit 4 [Lamprotula scripta]AND82416.1 NADH dehydrogenase subunit 4 [Lamprotula scripta]
MGVVIGVFGLFSGLVLWWGFTWGCVVMFFVSLEMWFSSVGLGGCCGEMMVVDSYSFGLVSLTILVSGLSVLASVRDVCKSGNNSVSFIFSVLALTVVLVFCFSLSSMLNFYIMFEFSLIPILLIILGWGYQPERLQAGKYMMLYTVSASLPLLVLILLVLVSSGSVFWWSGHCGGFGLSWLVTLCASLAFVVKLPIYGFHLWLPKAHVEAPVAGSMILAGVLLKLGGYGLIRIFYVLGGFSCFVMTGMFCLGLGGGVIASVIWFRSKWCEGLSGLFLSWAYKVGFSRGIFKYWVSVFSLFADNSCAWAMFFWDVLFGWETYKCYSTRSLYLVKGGLALIPGVALCWFLMCAINMAAPPSLNLWAELMLGISVLSYSVVFAALTGVMTFLSGLYSWYVYSATQHGQSPLWVRGGSLMEEFVNYVVNFVLVFSLMVVGVSLTCFLSYLTS